MQEFMLLIRNENGKTDALPPELHQEFLAKCMEYINNLVKEEKLVGAQPLLREGTMLSGTKGAWKDGPFNETKEVIVGYYHILAKDMEEAIAIAKGNPEFAYTSTARIEIRPIKVKEPSTAYVYPAQ